MGVYGVGGWCSSVHTPCRRVEAGININVCWSRSRALDPLKLEVQVTEMPAWVLRTKLKSSIRAAHAANREPSLHFILITMIVCICQVQDWPLAGGRRLVVGVMGFGCGAWLSVSSFFWNRLAVWESCFCWKTCYAHKWLPRFSAFSTSIGKEAWW